MRKSGGEFDECMQCLCFGLRRAARAITQHYERHLREHGLRATQFTLLTALAIAGPMPMQRLATQLGVERTTLTRNLGPLQARGLVEAMDSDDRRVRMVTITAKGRAAIRAALPAWRKAQSAARAKLARLGWQESARG